jgi:hypothetical protein
LNGDVPTPPKSPSNDGDLKVPNSPENSSSCEPLLEHSTNVSSLPTPERLKEEEEENTDDDEGHESKPQTAKPKRKWQTREMREAHLAERAAADASFLKSFNPRTDWLPPNTRSEDYTPEFCKDLERRFWRNCGFGSPAMYGADMEGRTRGPILFFVIPLTNVQQGPCSRIRPNHGMLLISHLCSAACYPVRRMASQE